MPRVYRKDDEGQEVEGHKIKFRKDDEAGDEAEVEGHKRHIFGKDDESGEEQAAEEQSEGEDVEGHRKRFV